MEFIRIPIGYLLGWIYQFVGNYGWAVILFTLVIKILLLPLGLKQQKSMTKMQAVQPKLTAIQEKYKNDKQKLSEETMKLYKQYGVSPMGGCLPLLIQLPILFALYRVLQQPLEYILHMNADEISALNDGRKLGQIALAGVENKINFEFFTLNLAENPKWTGITVIIPILAGVTTFISSKVSTMISKKKKENEPKEQKQERVLSPNQKKAPGTADASQVGSTMTWIMPIFTLWITTQLPGAMGIYWTASNVFSMIQTVVLNGYYSKKMSTEIEATEVQLQAQRKAKFANKKRKGKN